MDINRKIMEFNIEELKIRRERIYITEEAVIKLVGIQ
jgi:hypothetical protein